MGATRDAQNTGRPLRADAQRNRQRVVEAARAVFAEKGLDVPLEDIADRAGVGIATLYRRFATREELVVAVFESKLLEHAKAAEEELEARDPWAGFTGYIERICALQAADRGFTDVIVMALPASEEAQRLRDRGYHTLVELIRRAQAAGTMRQDFVAEDIPLLLMATAGVIHATRDAAPHAWRRLVAYLLEGFRAEHSNPLPAAPTPSQTYRAMIGNAHSKGICPVRNEDSGNEDSSEDALP
ncbi:helix-turn-helix domain-containing protein [Streptomyces phaeochromogenes]|uniref:TetR/AcrR family transcriptional regulator n=1 Tax=Streptomyces phaeochromogenes TaxID=1923 RepID=UPI002DDC2C30|nr:helix-turn-helix domain-containing protein [Streptomyces phaeochromogenes]WRZ34475.1 TetR/AcrR family transcriptional regulator [Streptomyces phaeochromogenes]